MDKYENKGIPYYLSAFAQDKEKIKMTANRGYVIAPQKIIRCFRLNDIEKVLLLELLSYMGANDYAFPSHKRLAFKLGKKSTASIKNALKSLKDKGFIDWRKGGGDIGSNRYTLNDLYSNPYLIMSEFTHFFVEEILGAHRDEISYENIYSTVLEIAEKPKGVKITDDPYGICIDWLFKDRNLRDQIDMYWLFGDILRCKIGECSGSLIEIDGFKLAQAYFQQYHPTVPIDYMEDHPIHKDLKSPNDEKPFIVRIEGMDDITLAMLSEYHEEIGCYLDTLNEKQLYEIFIEKIVLDCPSAVLETSRRYSAFMNAEDIEDCINLVRELYPPYMLKVMLNAFYTELKWSEIDAT